MDIIFHIGQGKAGSTTLQDNLSNLSDYLRNRGILYISPRDFNVKATIWSDILAGENSLTLPPHAKQFLDKLNKKIEQENPRRLVASSEFVFSLEYAATRLRSILSRWSSDVTIVAYVREPVSRYISVLQQHLKATSAMLNPARWRAGYEHLDMWNREFHGNIIVKPFERTKFLRQCMVQDFLVQILSIEPGDTTDVPVVNSNVSEFSEVTSIVQKYFQQFYPRAERKFRPDSNRLRTQLQNIANREELGSKAKAKPDIAEAILANHARQLLSLREDWGVEFSAVEYTVLANMKPTQGAIRAHRFSDVANVNHEDEQALMLHMLRRALLREPQEAEDFQPSSAAQSYSPQPDG